MAKMGTEAVAMRKEELRLRELFKNQKQYLGLTEHIA